MVLRERKVKEDDEPATEGELMDIDEQDSLIAELRTKGEAQSRNTRKIFLLMSGGLFLAIIYCTVMALSVPYVLEHQERFKASVSPIGFAFSYVLDIVAILVAMISVRGRKDKFLQMLGVAAGVVNLLFWVGVFAQETPMPSMGFWWLPLTPLFIISTGIYIDYDLIRLDHDINHLEQLKYDFKKV